MADGARSATPRVWDVIRDAPAVRATVQSPPGTSRRSWAGMHQVGSAPGPRAAQPEMNWARNLTYRAARLHRPRTVAEVQQIVASSERVKALGSRHCFNDIADTPADHVSLDALETELEFEWHADGTGGIAWVPGGMRYGTLVTEL